MLNAYKKAVLNDLKLATLAQKDVERLYELCVGVWGRELNPEHLADEMLKTDELINTINRLPN